MNERPVTGMLKSVLVTEYGYKPAAKPDQRCLVHAPGTAKSQFGPETPFQDREAKRTT
jgi:hypothetical protein